MHARKQCYNTSGHSPSIHRVHISRLSVLHCLSYTTTTTCSSPTLLWMFMQRSWYNKSTRGSMLHSNRTIKFRPTNLPFNASTLALANIFLNDQRRRLLLQCLWNMTTCRWAPRAGNQWNRFRYLGWPKGLLYGLKIELNPSHQVN